MDKKTNRIKSLKQRRLDKIKNVIEVYKLHYDPDIPDVRIYRKYIEDRFHISLSTFRQYLGVNIKKEQEEIDNL